MKSYYSITLFILFVFVMALMGVVKTAMLHQDLSPADAAIVALTIIAALLAYRLSQAEKRIAHLEDQMEEKDTLRTGKEKHNKNDVDGSSK
jgi:hypothetical protein